MKVRRRLAKPIFSSDKNVTKIAAPMKQIIDAPMDIVLLDDEDESVEEIELHIAGNVNVFDSPEKFWQHIDDMGWKDRSSLPKSRNRWYGRNVNTGPKKDSMSISSAEAFDKYCNKYYLELKALFEEKNVFESLERVLQDGETCQLLSHILAKGQVYYATIMSEPYFCGALVAKSPENDEFEDFYKYFYYR